MLRQSLCELFESLCRLFQLDRDGLHDLNVQGDWQKKNGTYWVRYVHVELLGHDSYGKTVRVFRDSETLICKDVGLQFGCEIQMIINLTSFALLQLGVS